MKNKKTDDNKAKERFVATGKGLTVVKGKNKTKKQWTFGAIEKLS